jgi:catechol 2,3-dioxygenase-like lactoylglutathione lyase family enzyme
VFICVYLWLILFCVSAVKRVRMLTRIDRLLLRVPSLESAIGYYRDVLGLHLVHHDKRIANFKLADGTTELLVHVDPDLPAEGFYFLVDDVRDLYARRNELKLQFVSRPAPVSRGYRAVVKDPFGHVLMLLDRTSEGDVATHVEDAKQSGALFAGVEQRSPVKKDLLIQIYQKIGRTADDLPYTPHFESLFEPYAERCDPKPSRAEVWRHLLNLRKAGKLPKLGEARSKPPEVPPESREALRTLLGADIGKRDRLPYTPRFDEITEAFNNTLPRPLAPHLIWRLIATLAK